MVLCRTQGFRTEEPLCLVLLRRATGRRRQSRWRDARRAYSSHGVDPGRNWYRTDLQRLGETMGRRHFSRRSCSAARRVRPAIIPLSVGNAKLCELPAALPSLLAWNSDCCGSPDRDFLHRRKRHYDMGAGPKRSPAGCNGLVVSYTARCGASTLDSELREPLIRDIRRPLLGHKRPTDRRCLARPTVHSARPVQSIHGNHVPSRPEPREVLWLRSNALGHGWFLWVLFARTGGLQRLALSSSSATRWATRPLNVVQRVAAIRSLNHLHQ